MCTRQSDTFRVIFASCADQRDKFQTIRLRQRGRCQTETKTNEQIDGAIVYTLYFKKLWISREILLSAKTCSSKEHVDDRLCSIPYIVLLKEAFSVLADVLKFFPRNSCFNYHDYSGQFLTILKCEEPCKTPDLLRAALKFINNHPSYLKSNGASHVFIGL